MNRLLLLLAALIAPVVHAQTVIDFDDQPTGLVPGDVYASLGVVFSTDEISDVSSVGQTFTFDATADPQIDIVTNASQATSVPNIAAPSLATGSGDTNDLLMDFTGLGGVMSVALALDNTAEQPEIVRLFALEATGTPGEFRILAVDEDTDDGIGKMLEVSLSAGFQYALFQITTEREGFDDLTFTLGTTANEPGGEQRAFRLVASPSPFQSSTSLTLDVSRLELVTVTVFDALGRQVATLHDGPLAAGTHTLRFEAADLPSGTYVVRASGARGVQTRAVTLLR